MVIIKFSQRNIHLSISTHRDRGVRIFNENIFLLKGYWCKHQIKIKKIKRKSINHQEFSYKNDPLYLLSFYTIDGFSKLVTSGSHTEQKIKACLENKFQQISTKFHFTFVYNFN